MTELALSLAGKLRRHTMAASALVVLGAAWWWQLAALQQARREGRLREALAEPGSGVVSSPRKFWHASGGSAGW